MKYQYKAFLVLLIALAAIAVANETTDILWNTFHLCMLAFFMYGTSVAVHHFTVKSAEGNPNRFPAYFMAITGIKMLVYIVFLGVYVFVFQKEAIPVVVGFLILYLAFTVLEVFYAVKTVR